MINFIRKYWVYIFISIIIINVFGGLYLYRQLSAKSNCSKIIFDINEKNLEKCRARAEILEKEAGNLQKQIDEEGQKIQTGQILPNSDLPYVDINTSDWHTYVSIDYRISFNYPNDWYYLINTFENGKKIIFLDKNDIEQMVLDDVRGYQDPPCLKDEQIYFFNTNSSSTDLLIALKNESLTEADVSAEIKWKNNLTKQDWIENSCRDFKKLYINTKPEEKKYDLSVLYEIAKSFKIFDEEEIKNIKPIEIYKQNNDFIKKEIMKNPEKYFNDLDYMKIADIFPGESEGIIRLDDNMNTKVNYAGKIIITGRYENNVNQQGAYFQDQVCFYIEDKESLIKIPKLKNGYQKNSVNFCFSNKELAKAEFAPEGSSGSAVIEVDDLVFHYADMGVIHYGSLVKVIKKNDGRKYLDEFSYSDKGYDIKLNSENFNILEYFNAESLAKGSSECGAEYNNELLVNYSNKDEGKKYFFSYQNELYNYENDPGEKGGWTITVIPNKLGYTDMSTFEKDFSQCYVGGDSYPGHISENYLFFVSSACGGADFYPDLPKCFDLSEFLEPTLEYY